MKVFGAHLCRVVDYTLFSDVDEFSECELCDLWLLDHPRRVLSVC